MLESQDVPSRDYHAGLGSLVESELSFQVWTQEKSNAEGEGPSKGERFIPREGGEGG